jgi:ribosomal protein L29
MKKAELKQILKPLIKECIKEVIFEDGVLSGIISEVVKGTSNKQIVEVKQPRAEYRAKSDNEMKQKIKETKSKLLHAMGADAYGGVDLFEGTQPMRKSSAGNPLSGVSSGDAGVDISQIPGMKNWKLLADK